MVQNVFILGSTGSIGINTLNVIRRYPKLFKVVGLSAFNNVEVLEQQIREFKPRFVAVGEKSLRQVKSTGKVFSVEKDLEYLVALKEVDTVVIAMKGSAALKPFLAALKAGKKVATANKEALVVAGELIMKEARRTKAPIIPIDSEQSAIFQCLEHRSLKELKKVHLTASGGPLLNLPESKFDRLSVTDILKHPRWKMGQRITVDSANLMNKGFEVIEAMHLFDVHVDDIEVLVHPEAIIHSMVEFCDGSIIAQLGLTDMRLPIQYALTYPKRLDSGLESLDFASLKSFTFYKPDLKKFPALALAITAGKKGGTYPAVLNGADEVAVDAFLEHKIKFTQIFKIVEKVISKHRQKVNPKLEDILSADQWAREEASGLI